MNTTLVWTLVALGVAALAVGRRAVATGLVTAQALVLVGAAVRHAGDVNDLAAAIALAVRTVGLAALLLFLITRTRERRLVPAGFTPLRRAGAGVALALALVWLVPTAGFASRAGERAVLALVAFGLVMVATHRATLMQILGLVVIENALVVAALELSGSSWLIELGLAFDITLVALVAGVFHRRIFTEFGAGDTGALRSLRD